MQKQREATRLLTLHKPSTVMCFYSISPSSRVHPSINPIILRTFASAPARKHRTRHRTHDHTVLQLALHPPRLPTYPDRRHTPSTTTHSAHVRTTKTHRTHNLPTEAEPETNTPKNPNWNINRHLLTQPTRRLPLHRHQTILPTRLEPTPQPKHNPIPPDIRSLRHQLHHSTHNVRLPPMEKTQLKKPNTILTEQHRQQPTHKHS